MAGLIKGAQGLVGALERAWKLAHGMEDTRELERVGRLFRESSEQDPAYFATGKELPEGLSTPDALDFLNRKHGTDLISHAGRVATPSGAYMTLLSDGNQLSKLGEQVGVPRAMLKSGRGGVGYDTPVLQIDTEQLRNDGSGRQLYPALWDFILSRRDAANTTQVLSEDNRLRRTANMAPLYEKYGDKANRVILDPDQVSASYDDRDAWGRVKKFHDLPADAQVGALNALLAQGVGGEVNRIGRGLTEARGDARGVLDRYLDEASDLGVHPERPWEPPALENLNEAYAPRLAQWLRDTAKATGATPPLVGETSLRRAALTKGVLDEGLTAADLADLPWLTRRLGRRHGGLIR